MAKEVKQWITVNGHHVPIYEGESKEQAVKRAIANKNEDDKEKQIAKNKEEADKLNGKAQKEDPSTKSQNRLDSKEDESKLRKELKEKLSSENDYTSTDEYKSLHDDITKINKERDAIEEKMKQLYEIEKKGTTVSDEDIKAFDGDKNLAMLFATKSPEAKKAEQELKGLREKKNELYERWEKACDKLKNYENQFVDEQKQALKKESTVSGKVKENYKGFQKDTATPYLQELQEKGDAYIVEMSPKEYLQRCASDIFDSTYERQVRAVLADAKHTYELADMMADGTKMYMPSLNYRDKQQEGRHRAAAAILNGIDRMPVLIVPSKRA